MYRLFTLMLFKTHYMTLYSAEKKENFEKSQYFCGYTMEEEWKSCT